MIPSHSQFLENLCTSWRRKVYGNEYQDFNPCNKATLTSHRIILLAQSSDKTMLHLKGHFFVIFQTHWREGVRGNKLFLRSYFYFSQMKLMISQLFFTIFPFILNWKRVYFIFEFFDLILCLYRSRIFNRILHSLIFVPSFGLVSRLSVIVKERCSVDYHI